MNYDHWKTTEPDPYENDERLFGGPDAVERAKFGDPYRCPCC
jgi:hypothetical protein